jgi:hypothetical protein
LIKKEKDMNRSIAFRIISGLVLLVALVALGIFAYNAGVAHGLATNVQAPAGEAQAAPYGYYWMPYHMPYWGFPGFGFLYCLIPLFFIFLAFAALRGLFGFRRYGWHRMHYGPWGMYAKDKNGEPWREVPPMFAEWHRKAHEQPTETSEDK